MTPTGFLRLAKGTDPVERLPVAYVAVERYDYKHRITVYKLIKRPKGWYNVGQFLSLGYYRSVAGKGRKLSDSQLCQNLISVAEAA